MSPSDSLVDRYAEALYLLDRTAECYVNSTSDDDTLERYFRLTGRSMYLLDGEWNPIESLDEHLRDYPNEIPEKILDFRGVSEPRPHVTCLCGSTRFRREYEDAFRREEHFGRICLTVPCFKDDIGQSTRNEIAYAKSLGKPVRYLVPINQGDVS